MPKTDPATCCRPLWAEVCAANGTPVPWSGWAGPALPVRTDIADEIVRRFDRHAPPEWSAVADRLGPQEMAVQALDAYLHPRRDPGRRLDPVAARAGSCALTFELERLNYLRGMVAPSVHRAAAGSGLTPEDRDQVTTDVWRQAARAIRKGQVRADTVPRLGGWVKTVSFRRVASAFRGSRPRSQVVPLDELTADPFAFDDAADAALAQERAERARAAVAALPADVRQVLDLRYFEGRDTAEIAALLGISRQAIRQRLHRAYLRLRSQALDLAPNGW